MVSSPDEFLQIDTPENVVFGYEIAGIGSRFMAAMVDHIAIGVMQVIVVLIVLMIGESVGGVANLDTLSAWVVAALALIAFALLWGYFILFETLWSGQTPGKRLVKLRVIRVDGTPITLVEALVRNLTRLIDFLPVTYGIGIVTMFIDSQSRRLGDLAAGTLVVFDRPEITLESLRTPPPLRAPVSLATQPGQPGQPTGPETEFPVERLTERDVAMVEDYLRRRRDLSGRDALARQMAQVLHRRMGLPFQPMPLDALDAWLARVTAAYRAYMQ
jgi:uncharacterized RDD family membrane protein YckC